MKQVYPTFILNKNDDSGGKKMKDFMDREGDTFADAIEMARDAIGLAGISMEDNKEEIPVPSDQNAAIEKVKHDTEDIDFTKGVLTYVDVDFFEYRKKDDTKTVRRNVAILGWLNQEAEHAEISVLRVLQKVLKNVLNQREIYNSLENLNDIAQIMMSI